MEREELGAWLRLTLTPGLGDTSSRRLLAAFGPPETLYTQTPPALQAVLTPAQAEALLQIPEGWAALLDSTWAWLQAEPATRAVVALGDPTYPQALLNIEDPPLLLYLSGRLDLPLDSARSLAIVGSRNPTPQGALNARQFAMALHAYTAGGAVAAGDEPERGRLAAGLLADVTLLSADIRSTAPERLRDVRVRETWVDGQSVFQA